MLTKFTLKIGSTVHDVPEWCLKNWDEIAFTLKRSDYSGVMRSFSTEFVFCGAAKDLLYAEYVYHGFSSSATVAVYTLTDTHGWEKQYEAALDFSTVEMENGCLSLNALDDALASKLKSKKSQKYEFSLDDLPTVNVNVERMRISNVAVWDFDDGINPAGYTSSDVVNAWRNTSASQVISEEYVEIADEVRNGQQQAANSFFAQTREVLSSCRIEVAGQIRLPFWPKAYDDSQANNAVLPTFELNLYKMIVDTNDQNVETLVSTLATADLLHMTTHNGVVETMVGGINTVYPTLYQLTVAQPTVYNGNFGVVGRYTDRSSNDYWNNNTVYEYQDGEWLDMGTPRTYAQHRPVSMWATPQNLLSGTCLRLRIQRMTSEVNYGGIIFEDSRLIMHWSDAQRPSFLCRAVRPADLIAKVVGEIAPGTAVTVAPDAAGLLADTLIIAGEELRRMTGAKIYTTFSDFAGWMEAVFGYTYLVDGDTMMFAHRSVVFQGTTPVKTFESVRDVKYSVNDDLIYSQVEAGYSKKDYGEIDGRLETNFTNYYSTPFMLTDKKLSLVSKYRSDGYGVEFTARKSESDTTDDKADEDVFFVKVTSGGFRYEVGNNEAYLPSLCVENNKGFIAAMNNNAAYIGGQYARAKLTMTSSNGNNELEDIYILNSDELFTCGEVEFSTDDMELPSDVNGLIGISADGMTYIGFIKEAKARFGKRNGMEYTMIVKYISNV